MSKTHASPALPRKVALELADLALVPDEQHVSFCDLLCDTVQKVWSRTRRAKPGPALFRAAEAARTLHEALGSLNKEDREWVEGLLAQHPATATEGWLPETVWLLANLFSFAVGNSPPPEGARPDQRGRRRGTVKNVIFQDFVFDLLTNAGATGGDFTFDRNYETGTLLEAIEILTPNLPEGVVPKDEKDDLPLATIQRIVTTYRKLAQRAHMLDPGATTRGA